MVIQLKHLVGHSGAGGSSTYNVVGGGGAGSSSNYVLIQERIEEWNVFYRFLEHNPDIKEKYQVYKTYEILKNDA